MRNTTTTLLCLAVALLLYHVADCTPTDRDLSTDVLIKELIKKLEKHGEKEDVDSSFNKRVHKLKKHLGYVEEDEGRVSKTGGYANSAVERVELKLTASGKALGSGTDTCPDGNIGEFPPQGALIYPAIKKSASNGGRIEHKDETADETEDEAEDEDETDGKTEDDEDETEDITEDETENETEEEDDDETEDETEDEEEEDDRDRKGKSSKGHLSSKHRRTKRRVHHKDDAAPPSVGALMVSRCSHLITVAEKKIYFIAITTNMKGSTNCADGQLNLYDGGDASAPPINDTPLCGSSLPVFRKSTGNQMFVDFVVADTSDPLDAGTMLFWVGYE